VLEIHLEEMAKGNGEYKCIYKHSSARAKETDAYLSLIKKAHFLNALSQQQMHYDYMMR